MNIPQTTKNLIIAGFMTLGVTTGQGLYNNLQAQTTNQITNTQTVNIINKITQGLKPEQKNEIQNLVSRTGNIADLYLKGCEFIDNQTPNFNFTLEEKFCAIVLVLDFKKSSKYYNTAKVTIEKNKNLQAITKRALMSVGLSIQIKSLQDGTSSIDDSIRRQQQIISGQQQIISGQQQIISGQQQTIEELNRLNQHIEKTTEMLNKMGK